MESIPGNCGKRKWTETKRLGREQRDEPRRQHGNAGASGPDSGLGSASRTHPHVPHGSGCHARFWISPRAKGKDSVEKPCNPPQCQSASPWLHPQTNKSHSEGRLRLTWSDCFCLPQPSKDRAPVAALTRTPPGLQSHGEGDLTYLWLQGTFWLLLLQLPTDNSVAFLASPLQHAAGPCSPSAPARGPVLWLGTTGLCSKPLALFPTLRKACSAMACSEARHPGHVFAAAFIRPLTVDTPEGSAGAGQWEAEDRSTCSATLPKLSDTAGKSLQRKACGFT